MNTDETIKRPCLDPRNPTGFILLETWMYTEGNTLGLTGSQLNVYAYILGYTKNNCEYYCGINFLAAVCNCDRRTTTRTLKLLKERGLIFENGTNKRFGQVTKTYRADILKADEAKQAWISYHEKKIAEWEIATGKIWKSDYVSKEIPAQSTFSEGRGEMPLPEKQGGGEMPLPSNAGGGEMPLPQTVGRGEMPPNNISIKDNNPTNPTSQTSENSGEDGWDEETEKSFKALCRVSLNQHFNEADTRAAYREALGCGYSSEDIAAAYDCYISRYRETHPDNPRYAYKLSKWLRVGNGMLFDMPQMKKVPEKKVEEFSLSDYLCSTNKEYDELNSRISGLSLKLIQLRLDKGNSKPELLSDLENEISISVKRLKEIEEASTVMEG